MKDALRIVNYARMQTANENETKDEGKYRIVHHAAGSLVNVTRPITRKGETSRLLYQTIGPFKVLPHKSAPNSGGSYNVYSLEHLGTGMSIHEDYRYAMQNKTTILNLILAEAVRKRMVKWAIFWGSLGGCRWCFVYFVCV